MRTIPLPKLFSDKNYFKIDLDWTGDSKSAEENNQYLNLKKNIELNDFRNLSKKQFCHNINLSQLNSA